MVLLDYNVCIYPELKGLPNVINWLCDWEEVAKRRERAKERVSESRHMLRDAFPRLARTDPAPNPSSRRCWAPMSLSLQLWRAAAWRRPGQRRLTGPWQGDCQPWGEWERIYINCFGDHQTFPSSISRPSFAHSLSLPFGMMLYYQRLLLRHDFTCCKSMQPERRTQEWRRNMAEYNRITHGQC